MKNKKEVKDNILVKFIVTVLMTLCAFALSVGVIIAGNNTEGQLHNTHPDTVSEKDIIAFVSDFSFFDD